MKIVNETAQLFFIFFIGLLISSGIMALRYPGSAIDIQLHDTYFVISSSHILLVLALFMLTLGSSYYLIPKLIGKKLNLTLIRIHLYLTIISALVVFTSMSLIGSAGVPRRYYRFDSFDAFNYVNSISSTMLIAALVFCAVQMILVINLLYSFIKRSE